MTRRPSIAARPRAACAALLALLLASACTAGAPGKPGAGAAPRSRVTTPKPGAKADPAKAGAKAGAARVLAKPATGVTTLRGKVTLEASYALGAGGTLLAAGGDRPAAVALAGARLDDAGRLLGDQGGTLLSDAGGNVVAPAAAGLAQDLGDGTLLAGGALVSDAGGQLIANNGGGLIANNGGAYRLAQTTPAGPPAPPAVGTELPAAGMRVSVVSLVDRRYLPLGVDAAGEPVYAVWSGVAGGFEVHVPDDAPTNLLVVASAPHSRDRRLALNVVVADRGREAAVDELGRLITGYVRRAFTGRLAAALRAPELAKTLALLEPSLTEPTRLELAAFIEGLMAIATEAGLPPDADAARQQRAAQRLADLVIADLDLAKMVISEADVARWQGRAPMPVLEAYRRTLTDILAGSAAKLRAEPGFFTQAYLADVVNAPNGSVQTVPIGDWTGAIRTPGDVGEFLLVEYFAAVRTNVAAPFARLSKTLYGALRPAEPDLAHERAAQDAEDLLYGAGMQTTVALARRFAQDPVYAARAREIFAAP